MVKCPNKNLPEWQEIERVAPNYAYTFWDLNNGNGIELAPNGANSKLFSSCLEFFNGDRDKAVYAKSVIMSNANRFGQSALDENGEPTFSESTDISKVVEQINSNESESKSKKEAAEERRLKKTHNNWKLISALTDITSTESLIDRLFEDANFNALIDDRLREILTAMRKIDMPLIWESFLEEGTVAVYDGDVITMFIDALVNSSNVNSSIVKAVAHELIHAYLQKQAYENKEFKSLIIKCRDEILAKCSKAEINEWYGLNAESYVEFLTEYLSNQEFRDFIANKNKSVSETIKRFISKLFNLLLGTTSKLEVLDKTASDLIYSVNNGSAQRYENSMELYEAALKYEPLLVDMENALFQAQMVESKDAAELANSKTYKFNTREEFDKRLKLERENLLKGYQSLYFNINDSSREVKTELQAAIKYNIDNLMSESISDMQVIFDFVNDTKDAVLKNVQEVRDAYTGKAPMLSDARLLDLDRNFFGFYGKAVNDVYNALAGMSEYRQIIGPQTYDKLVHDLNYLNKTISEARNNVKMMQVENAREILQDHGVSISSPTMAQYIHDTFDAHGLQTENDITTLSRLFFAGDKMQDEAVRSLFSIVQQADHKTAEAVFNKAKHLMNLLKEVSGGQKQFVEVDDNGVPTGYIIRDKRYGEFQRDFNKFIDELRVELGLSPGEVSSPDNLSVRREYNRRKNEWLAKHAERKYKPEYYELFYNLSDETVDAREAAYSKLRKLKAKYADEQGNTRWEDFTDADMKTYRMLEMEKRQLANIYFPDGTLKEPGTVERLIADELTALNAELAKNMETVVNEEKFAKIRNEKMRTLSEEKFAKWEEFNTRTVYADEFYEALRKIERNNFGEDYEILSAERKALLDLYRDPRTGEVDTTLMHNRVFNRINEIELQLRRIRKSNKTKAKNAQIQFREIARVVPTSFFKEDMAKMHELAQDDVTMIEIWYETNTVYLPSGERIPKSWYQKIEPRNPEWIRRKAPSSNFNELSENSKYYNPNYDHSNPKEYYQPKGSLYDNSKAFNALMKDKKKKELYDALVETMAEAQALLVNRNNLNPYKLPQITGTEYRVLMNSDGIFRKLWRSLKDKFTKRNDDEEYNEKPDRAPDGSALYFIPQYYIDDLKNVGDISVDVVGSILAFYKMANNWSNKNEIRAKVEIIKEMLAQRRYVGSNKRGIRRLWNWSKRKTEEKAGTETEIYKFVHQFIEMNVYNIQYTTAGAKLVNFLRTIGTIRNLGLNIASAGTGLFTAAYGNIVNALVGRYYDKGDAINAAKFFVADLFKHGINIENRHHKSLQMALMEFFEIGTTMDTAYKNSNQWKIARFFKKNWAMGIWSLSDYINKGLVLNSVMSNYKNVDGVFICKEDYLNKYGDTAENNHKWKTYTSALASLKFENGKIITKDPKDQAAWDKVKHKIGNTARNLAAASDGQLTPLQKAQFSANVYGALCMMHRNYLPIILQERFLMEKVWDHNMERYNESVLQSVIRIVKIAWADEAKINFIRKLIKARKSEYLLKTNTNKLFIDMLASYVILPYVVSIIYRSAEDDDSWYKKMLAYISMRTLFEIRVLYNIMDVYNTIKTPTPLYDFLDNSGTVLSYPFMAVSSLVTGEEDRKITRGAYKGWSATERALMKTTPFKNPYEQLLDLDSKIGYYKTQIMKDNSDWKKPAWFEFWEKGNDEPFNEDEFFKSFE